MHKDVKEILYTEEELLKRAKEIGRQITEDYKGEDIVLVGVLRGAVIFLADIMRGIELDCIVDFISVRSYEGTVSGKLEIINGLSVDIENKNVIIVEDILDTGKTLYHVKEEMMKKKPKSLKICALLDKKTEKYADIKADYTGFYIKDEFVVGYGLDYSQKYRNLPYIGVIKEEAI